MSGDRDRNGCDDINKPSGLYCAHVLLRWHGTIYKLYQHVSLEAEHHKPLPIKAKNILNNMKNVGNFVSIFK